MKETYVKLVSKFRLHDIDVYCPIDLKNHRIIVGLSLIGFIPDGAEIVGEFDEDTQKLKLTK